MLSEELHWIALENVLQLYILNITKLCPVSCTCALPDIILNPINRCACRCVLNHRNLPDTLKEISQAPCPKFLWVFMVFLAMAFDACDNNGDSTFTQWRCGPGNDILKARFQQGVEKNKSNFPHCGQSIRIYTILSKFQATLASLLLFEKLCGCPKIYYFKSFELKDSFPLLYSNLGPQ